MAANKCDECGTKINRKTSPYRFKHGSHTHVFCDPPWMESFKRDVSRKCKVK